MIKRVKISDRKFSLIVRCFSNDITSVSCAGIVKVNRKTADRYYQYFRGLILKNQEEERREFLAEDETEVDEAYFGPTRVRGRRGRGASKKIAVVGLLQRKGKVFTKPVDRCTKRELLPVILNRVRQGVDVFTDGWKSYDALAIYGFNHKKVKHQDNEFSDGNGNHVNGIESFWSFAKRRLAKFNGIRKKDFANHLKETEWRFNNRGRIEKMLRKLIREDRKPKVS
jgi:transposase